MAAPTPENQLLLDTKGPAAEQPPVARGRARRVAATLAGLTAAGVAAVVVGRSFSGPRAEDGPVAASETEVTDLAWKDLWYSAKVDYDLRQDRRHRLKIEDDLGQHVTENNVPGNLSLGMTSEFTAAEMAEEFFNHILHSSGLKVELTHTERHAFRQRFVWHMAKRAKTQNWPYGAGSWKAFFQNAKVVLEHAKPVVTKAFADSLNAAGLGFKARRLPWMVHESKVDFMKRLGRKPVDGNVTAEFQRSMAWGMQQRRLRARMAVQEMPAVFDPRVRWPKCAGVIGRVHNQGHCGSCWIFAALGSADSRMCINTDGQFVGDDAMLSRGYAASCVHTNGCGGGWEYEVFQYMERNDGVPSTKCSPYFAHGPGTEHFQQSERSPPCPSQCEPTYGRGISEDYFQANGMAGYRLILNPQENDGIAMAKEAMFEHGPLPFGIYASSAFMAYAEGVFSLDCGYSANHAVLALGWGADHLLATNSWGAEWGDNGHFRVGWCVPTDFTIPGPITDTKCPMPLPTVTHTTTTTTPPPVPAVSLCPTDPDGCVTSPGYDGDYPVSHECQISYQFGRIRVEAFSTEKDYDYMEINGEKYSGTKGPDGVVPKTNIFWSSDYSNVENGWKICPCGAR